MDPLTSKRYSNLTPRSRLLRLRGSSYTRPNRSHHQSYTHSRGSRREGSQNQRAHRPRPEAIQVCRGKHRALRREGPEQRSIRYRSVRVPQVQAPRRSCRPKGRLWCPPIRNGVWRKGLRSSHLWKASCRSCKVHEVHRWFHDPVRASILSIHNIMLT